MTNQEIKLVIAQHKDAIVKLRALLSKMLEDEEPDPLEDEIFNQIAEYRDKIEEAAWEGITTQTEALEALAEELKVITDRASNVPQAAEAISKLKELTKKTSDLAKSTKIKCKSTNCGADIVLLPNVLATAVAGPGGKKKLKLTCRNGHTDDYEISGV
jgi:hypothetical protein